MRHPKDDRAAAPAANARPRELVYVPGSTKKVSQLTGDFDRPLGKPTLSRTGARFGVHATDLGSSFEHKGRLYFLFGDTWGRPGDSDAVAWTASRDPERILLDFHKGPDGKWLAPEVPGVRLGAFEIPSGGISIGGRMYVVFTTDYQADKGLMGRSVLAVSADDGRRFRVLYDLSRTSFINVSMWQAGEWVYVFGSGAYRKSSVRLARVKASDIERRDALEYFGGVAGDGRPRWSRREGDAAPLFRHDVVGEFSVAYITVVGRYVALYNSSAPRGITMRSSPTPWGPWSDGQVIFEPWRDGGYGHFLHISSTFKGDRSDTFHDPRREAEWGGEYGPYLMSRYTTPTPSGGVRLYYTLSTWNPYQVVVMRTDLKPDSGATPPRS